MVLKIHGFTNRGSKDGKLQKDIEDIVKLTEILQTANEPRQISGELGYTYLMRGRELSKFKQMMNRDFPEHKEYMEMFLYPLLANTIAFASAIDPQVQTMWKYYRNKLKDH